MERTGTLERDNQPAERTAGRAGGKAGRDEQARYGEREQIHNRGCCGCSGGRQLES